MRSLAFTVRHAIVAATIAALAACSGGGADSKPNPECQVAQDCAAPPTCKTAACVGGACVVSPTAVGASCGGGLVCSAEGACLECLTAAGCPGADTACQTRTCDAGTCGVQLTAAGTPLPTQTAGDCHEDRCDGLGNVTSVVNDLDVPDDGNSCTADACTGGTPSSTPVATGTPCSAGVCNAAGQCVGCVVASDCPGTDTDCRARTCGAGVCGVSHAAAGTVTSGQISGDCHRSVCDGAGSAVPEVDDTDVPVDGNACTADVCTSGVATNPPSSAGTACATGGGTVCNGAGACVECVSGAQCTSGVCAANVCQAPACNDLVRNGAETDVDCGGGACGPCAVGKSCLGNADCASTSCVNQICSPPCHPVVNEVQASVTFPFTDWVELYSGCAAPLDVSGWRLSYFPFGTGNSEYVEYTFPAGTTFAPMSYLLFANSFYAGMTDGPLPNGLNGSGAVGLLDAVGRKIDVVAWGSASGTEGASAPAPGAGQSIGRRPNGADTDVNAVDFSIYSTPTPRAPNP